MPIYEYQCLECEHRFEEIQKFSEPRLVDCPECHQPKLKKLVSAAAFRLKGSGWYETDFKSGNKKNLVDGASSEKSDSGDSKTSDKSTSDSKTGTSESGTSKSSETKSNTSSTD